MIISHLFSATKYYLLQIEGDTVLGLAKFFLSIGIPGSSKDFFYQVESLSCFEKNRQEFSWVLSIICQLVNYFLCIISYYMKLNIGKFFLCCSAFIPLVFSLPSSVLSSSTKDLLKVLNNSELITIYKSLNPQFLSTLWLRNE